MPITVGEVDNGLTHIVWKTKVKHVSQYHINEKIRVDRFHPCTTYTVACHLYSKPIKNQKDKYEIKLYLVWYRHSPIGESSLSGCSKPMNHHRPFVIWGSVGGGEKFKFEKSREGEKKEWASKRINFKFQSNKEDLSALNCQFWIEFETFSRSEKNTLKHLKDLYVKQTNCDVHFYFKEREHMGAHSTILAARSPVFAAMFQHNMEEAVTGQVYIEDIQPDFFDQLLHYIYSGRTLKPMTEASAQTMYVAADKYDIGDLKKDCVRFLLSCVRVDNVVNLMIWSHSYLVKKVKEAAVTFAARHGKEICKLECWEKLTKYYPELSVLTTRRMMENMSMLKTNSGFSFRTS